MTWINFLLFFTFAGVGFAFMAKPPANVSVSIAATSLKHPLQTLKQYDVPPPSPNPGSTTGGGRRGGACLQSAELQGTEPQDTEPQDTEPQDTEPQSTESANRSLTALSPTDRVGLTLAERPTVLVYVPQTTARSAEFSLIDQNNNGIYQTTFALTETSGIVKFELPPDAPALEIGTSYTWYFAVICDPDNRLQDGFVTGAIQRIRLTPEQIRQVEPLEPRERAKFYGEIDIWYDTIAIVYDLRRSQPDTALDMLWAQLLRSAGLDSLADQ